MKKTILDLIRERRKYEYQTIDGYKPADKLMHDLLSEEIEILMKTIGAQNKTILKKEAKGNLFLLKRLKEVEIK